MRITKKIFSAVLAVQLAFTPLNTMSTYAVSQVTQPQKQLNPAKLPDVTLLQGESFSFTDNAIYSSADSCIKLEGNKCIAIEQGTATVSATLPETVAYVKTTVTFKVNIIPRSNLNLEISDLTLADTAKYNNPAELSFTLSSNFDCTVPITAACNGDEIYSTILNVQQGSHSYAIRTNPLKQKDKQTIILNIEKATAELDVDIIPPDFTINIDNVPEYLRSGEFIQIGYTVTATGSNKNLDSSLQVLLDDQTIAKEQLILSDTLSSKKSTIGVYLPNNLADGNHKLRLCIVFDNRLDIVWDEKSISTLTANLGLQINGQGMKTTDTYICASSNESANLNLTAVNSKERIKAVSYDGKNFSVGKSSYLAVVALKKAEQKILNVTIQSADGSEERDYSITIVRTNDDTAVSGLFTDENGKTYSMDTSRLPFRISLPADVTKGTLTVSVIDESARITSINNVASGKTTDSCEVIIGKTGVFQCKFEVCAEDKSIHIPYEVVITNLNYSPEVRIVNGQEISNKIFGSKGILSGKEFLEYGTKTTSVKAALKAGKTKGIIIDLDVNDYNYNQYLAGSITVQGREYPIHWNSLDGIEREEASKIEHGYIYIDHSLLVDAEMAIYNIVVHDYIDEFTEASLSETVIPVVFGINTLADTISAYFDETKKEITVDTSANNYRLSYRTSKDNGITWSQPWSCSSHIPVKEIGRVTYEVTLIDYMQNISVKTITLNLKNDKPVEGVSVFTMTTRHADYIYINTLKSNTDTLDIMIADIFK